MGVIESGQHPLKSIYLKQANIRYRTLLLISHVPQLIPTQTLFNVFTCCLYQFNSSPFHFAMTVKIFLSETQHFLPKYFTLKVFQWLNQHEAGMVV